MMKKMKDKYCDICHHPDRTYMVSVHHGNDPQEIEKDSERLGQEFPAYKLSFFSSPDWGFATLLTGPEADYKYYQPLLIKDKETGNRATVDLMLLIDEHYYAATVAHVALKSDQIKTLRRRDKNKNHKIIKYREELGSTPTPTDRWKLYDHMAGNVTNSQCSPLISFQTLKKPGSEDLLLDIALFRMPQSSNINELVTRSCTYIAGDSFGRNPKGPLKGDIKGILTVLDVSLPAIRKALIRKNKKIKVIIGETVGRITCLHPEWNWAESQDCLRFRVEAERRLLPGRSGSVVYAIKRGTTDLYVLGMLHGEKGRYDAEHFPAVEECFFVSPVIRQALDENDREGEKFRLAGIDPTAAVVEEDISTFKFEMY